jgi:hypothetical protein
MLGTALRFIRTTEEISGPGIYLTNYESVREGKIDVSGITAVGLDEAEVLRGFGGTKTFREFMAKLAGDDRTTGIRTDGVPYRFVATATPSPNDYIELLAYAAFLGVMDVGEGKTRFFKRDPAKADNLTLYEHKVPSGGTGSARGPSSCSGRAISDSRRGLRPPAAHGRSGTASTPGRSPRAQSATANID